MENLNYKEITLQLKKNVSCFISTGIGLLMGAILDEGKPVIEVNYDDARDLITDNGIKLELIS
jgi:hypothetical protein